MVISNIGKPGNLLVRGADVGLNAWKDTAQIGLSNETVTLTSNAGTLSGNSSVYIVPTNGAGVTINAMASPVPFVPYYILNNSGQTITLAGFTSVANTTETSNTLLILMWTGTKWFRTGGEAFGA